jgi:hypothetical protein
MGNRKIKSITGMTAEIEPKTGHVVQIFTTDTVGDEFLRFRGGPAAIRTPSQVCSASTKVATSAKPTKPLDVYQG